MPFFDIAYQVCPVAAATAADRSCNAPVAACSLYNPSPRLWPLPSTHPCDIYRVNVLRARALRPAAWTRTRRRPACS